MKLLTFLLFAGSMTLSASSYSQKTKINLQLQNSTLGEIFNSIEKSSEFIFFYNDEAVNDNIRKSVDLSGENIEKILEQLLVGTNIAYKIDDRQVFLYKKDDLKSLDSSESLSLIQQPNKREISGTVKDSKGLSLPGVTVVVKGTTIGAITDNDGKFGLSVPDNAKTLVFSFVGMKMQEFSITGKTSLNVLMTEEAVGLDELIVVGYGTQKKASVVGAITNTTYKELTRSGGVTNLGQALTGNLPGLTTIQTSSQPGRTDPKIYIRGQSTWNGGEPYILVDGVERKMNDLDMSEVDNVSVLKDASATAVYGVKGANGVILITTKRGVKGKPVLSVSANSSMKIPSRMVDKLDSYDALMLRNAAVEREVSISESSWPDYTPLAIVERYRNQANLKYPEAYPNVDWQDVMVKKAAFDKHVNISVSGGTDFAKYFSSLSYLNEGDLLKTIPSDLGYKPGLGYDRFNFRSNLDLNLTRTTTFKINLAGTYSVAKDTYSFKANEFDDELRILIAAYLTPPDAYMPRYSDGLWGKSPIEKQSLMNSAEILANSGVRRTMTTNLTSDFSLTQKLDFITKGLSATANMSFDNNFTSVGGIYNQDSNAKTKFISPSIEDMPLGGDPNAFITLNPVVGLNQFDFVVQPWTLRDEDADTYLSRLRRRLFYQGQINYARTFGLNDVTATGVFNREQMATGSEFQRYREDWVFRTTYNFDNRFFAEFNGAYNGSEKFSSNYRFDFFPSAAGGWTISNEKFMKKFEWLDKLKVRYSYGLIGDDNITQRWLYATQWAYGSQTYLSENAGALSPYNWYKESNIGNPDIHWEKASKSNLGFEMAVLKNLLSANVEYFNEDRTDILLDGASRVVPVYFGGTPPTANVGRVTKKGYEVEIKFDKRWNNGLHLWVNASKTKAVDHIEFKEEPQLKDDYLKEQGFQIGQTRSTITDGFINNWNEVYASTPNSTNDQYKIPGNYNIIDFNGDGVIDGNTDTAPYGYSSRPQNTYNLSLGTDYKGFSVMLQFYGVNNVTRYSGLLDFSDNQDIAYSHALDYWSKDNLNASSFLPRFRQQAGAPVGDYFQFDGSYLRLKTAEVAYTLEGAILKRTGLSSLKIYLNGNNLIFWSKLPDDREQGWQQFGSYPSPSRINLGVDLKF